MEGFSSAQSETLARIGATLMLMQAAERVISMSIQLALPKGGFHTIESLTQPQAKETLGQLLAKLRTTVEIDERLDAWLREFLAKRNSLIHDAGNIPRWSLNSESGIAAANFPGAADAALPPSV